MDDRASHALAFGPAADAYDRLRPTYPPDAVAWALGRDPVRVVDLGAGTGILSRVLVGLGHTVLPVEPDERMRAQLAAMTPGVDPLAGAAEDIPLPDGTADAVMAGQAYHWFDPARAHPEIARVLRPGGVFAPIWNIRDESAPWVVRLSEIIEAEQKDHAGMPRERDFGPMFHRSEWAEFRHSTEMTAQRLLGLVSTRSYYLVASPERRAEIDEQVRALAADLPETFELPYRTYVYRAVRR